MDTPQQLALPLVCVQPNEHNFLKFAEEFATAQYKLTPLELKAWILLISSLKEPQKEGLQTIYTFDGVSFGDKMGIDRRKSRSTEVAKILSRLAEKYIDFRSTLSERGGQDIFHSQFIASVDHKEQTHRIEVEIPLKLHPFLFALKLGTFVNIEVEDILSLNSVAAIRIFIYCKNLERLGIHTVEIQRMRQENGFMQSSYDSFKSLQQFVIKPAVNEIRKHTEYKEFFIESNGGRGRKATHLHFGFTPNFDSEDLFLDTSQDITKVIVNKFSPAVQISIRIAMDNGFNPRYIKDKFDNVTDDVIKANFLYVDNIIAREKREGHPKPPEVYGKYYIKAVLENWALKNEKFDEMKKLAKRQDQNIEMQQKMKEAQERDDAANSNEFYRTNAIKYLEAMDFTALDNFIRTNINGLNVMAGKAEFNYEHAVSRKKNYREYRLLVNFITAKMTLREIDLPRNIFNHSGR